MRLYPLLLHISFIFFLILDRLGHRSSSAKMVVTLRAASQGPNCLMMGTIRIGWDHEDGVLHASQPLSAGINIIYW